VNYLDAIIMVASLDILSQMCLSTHPLHKLCIVHYIVL